MSSLWQDLRYGVRMLRKTPGLTVLVFVTLGIGIGANTAIYGFVNALLLRPLPYSNPDRLVCIWETRASDDSLRMRVSYPDYIDWVQQNHALEGFAGFDGENYTLLSAGLPSRISGTLVTSNFFSLLGVRPFLGRDFLASESERVTIVSYDFWERQFGGDPSIVGKTISLSYELFTIVGVLPADFQFALDRSSVVWVPLKPSGDDLVRRDRRWLTPIGRLRPNVTLAQAQREMSGIAGRLAREHPETNRGVGVRLGLIRDEIVGNVRPMLLLLMAAVVFVLLIACANVANLLSVRSVIRRKEFAIRLALGAGRKRLVRQLLVESVLLALLGGLCGLLIAIWSTRFLVGLIPGNLLVNLPLSEHVTLDWRVLAFNFLFATLTGVLVGLVPARQSFRVSGMETLKEGEQWSMGGKQKELGSLLVVSEVALLLVLLAGTGLVLTSLQRLLQVDPGFRLDQLLTMGISLPETKYTEPAQVAQFYQELLRRVAAAPGVKEVAMIDELPLTNDRISTHLYVPGQARPAPGLEQGAVWRTVSPNYFQCAGIPLLRGRPFTPHDDASAGLAVILSKELARRLFDVEDPIGRQVRMISDGSLRQVVGVVGDVKLGALDRPALPALYTSNLQEPSNTNDLVIQARILPAELSNTVRRLAQELDSELPARSIRTMSEIVQSSPAVSIRRSTALLLTLFAAIALVLAVTGLYGVVSYSVAQRTREIGLRIALGAEPGGILRLILRSGLMLSIRGTVLGLVCSIGLTRFMSSVLFEVSATDPFVFGVVSVLLTAVALGACYLPARKAALIEPAEALRRH